MDRAFLDFLAFLAASSDNLRNEPPVYGELRLIDALGRAIELFRARGILSDSALDEIEADIEENKFYVMSDPEAFHALLKRTNAALAKIVSEN